MQDIHTVNSIHSVVGHSPSKVHSRLPDAHADDERDSDNDLEHTPSRANRNSTLAQHSSEATVKTVSRLSPFGCLLSRTLPEYKGQYPVGVFDIELPVKQPRSIGSFRHKELHSPSPGFTLETVLFSVFYPADVSEGTNSNKVVWFPRLSQTVNGFLKMARRTSWLYKGWHISTNTENSTPKLTLARVTAALAYPIAAAAIYGTTFPAISEAPLRKPPREGQQWPLAIFSHGVGCSRLMYSSICGELASRGYVVCAIEHRDGTGPSTAIRLDDGTYKDLDFLNWQMLHWPNLPEDQQPENDTTLRHDQLEMRCAEINEVIQAMQAINSGDEIVQHSIKSPHFDWQRWGPAWDAINCNKPVMVGHSLGGSVALLAASRREEFHFRSVVAMDPACQRLEPWTGTIECPLLVINSEEYTLSSDYERLQKLAETASTPPVYSIAGSTHPSFSDVFLIVPGFINRMTGLYVDADEMLDSTMDLVLGFLRDKHEPMRAKTSMIREWQGPLSRPLGEPGNVFWHPVGEETLLGSVQERSEEDEEEDALSDEAMREQERSKRVGSIDEDREFAPSDNESSNPLAGDKGKPSLENGRAGHGHHHHLPSMHVILHDTVKAKIKRDEMVED